MLNGDMILFCKNIELEDIFNQRGLFILAVR